MECNSSLPSTHTLRVIFLSRVSSSTACSLWLISRDKGRSMALSCWCELYREAMTPAFLAIWACNTYSCSYSACYCPSGHLFYWCCYIYCIYSSILWSNTNNCYGCHHKLLQKLKHQSSYAAWHCPCEHILCFSYVAHNSCIYISKL